MLTPGNIVSYCVLDVSRSGLAFCYNGTVNRSGMLNSAHVTFFAENLGSSDIAVHIVSDTELNEKMSYQPEGNRAKMPYLRRCGVKFKQLSPEQENTISDYIQHLSTALV
jgi:hypothetical protein